MKRVLIIPKETQPMHDGFHFSQTNRVGDIIWLPGQVGIDDKLKPASGNGRAGTPRGRGS